MSSKLDYPNPYKKSAKQYILPNFLQLGAGPTNVSLDVLNAMLSQPITPANEHMFKAMDDIKAMAKHVFQTNNPLTIAIQLSGNGANETMVTNLVDPGETIIIAVAGFWGNKVVDMAERYGVNVVKLTTEAGEIYSYEELEAEIIKHKPVALFVTHGESSGGTLQPLDGLGDICHRHNCLLVVDAVVSLGVVPIYTDRWGIDGIAAATQKGIGAPAGMSLVSLSERAHERMLNKKKPPPYNFDLKPLSDVWKCFGKPRTYHYTYSSNLLYAVRQALTNICEEGLEEVWTRHKHAAHMFWEKLEMKGWKQFVVKPENRFLGVTCLVLPNGVDWPAFMQCLLEKHQVEIGFGVGPTTGKAMRIGLLGPNARPEIVDYLIEVIGDAIETCQSGKIDITHKKLLSV